MSAAANLICPSGSHRAVRGSLLLWLLPVLLAFLAGCAHGGSAVNTGPEQAGAGTLTEGSCPNIFILGHGTIHGSSDGDNTCAYRGIQYATADRWQPSKGQLMQPGGTSWLNTFGPVCPQTIPIVNLPTGEEQCLFLNVWNPQGTTPTDKKPVMVFIHGGAFVSGSGDTLVSHPFNGKYLSGTNGMVLVTFNYRLGALGTLFQNATTTGNFGLLDQQAALEWVQRYIHYFGGDRDKVMVFGESAGAMSVGLHLMSTPSGQNRQWPFRAALMESNPLGVTYKSNSEAQAIRGYLQAKVGGDLNGATKDQILKAQGEVAKDLVLGGGGEKYAGLGDLLAWAPTLDSITVKSQPVAGKLPLPTVLGTNRDEGTLFAALIGGETSLTDAVYSAMLAKLFPQASVKVAQIVRYKPLGNPSSNTGQLANVVGDYLFTCANAYLASRSTPPQVSPFVYQFTHVPSVNIWPTVPECATQVCHAAELPFVFHNESNLASQQELALSANMAGYWSTFASQLSPGSAPVSWPAYSTGNYLDLNLSSSAKSKNPLLALANCSFWDTEVGYGTSSFTTAPLLQLSE